MQCIQVDIVDDGNILEEIMETFRVTLTATEPFVTIQSQQESILINIIEDPLDGKCMLSVIFSVLIFSGSISTALGINLSSESASACVMITLLSW